MMEIRKTRVNKEASVMSAQYRSEHDSLGTKDIPAGAYYGVQSLRAAENFRITGLSVHPQLITSVAEIKKAAALTNLEIGLLDRPVAEAIIRACNEITAGRLHNAFIVDPIQGGAGTSLNMNANEVIANRAIELLGGRKGDYALVSPYDHVNRSQSTNDVIPSAGKLTVLKLLTAARAQLERLCQALETKGEVFDDVLKMGRTQMQDAVPIRLGQEFRAYGQAVRRDIDRLGRVQEEMRRLNMGGTAVGTGINADGRYLRRIVPNLSKVTGLRLVQAEDLIDATQNADAFVSVSGAVKTCAVNLSKLSNDLRLMSSGPRCGLGEIELPPRQNGSSIMPGKVNPVIPEVVNQVAFQIMGNDLTITMAAEAGQLELNAFEPVILHNLIQSVEILDRAAQALTDHCIAGITANRERCRALVENSVGLITALCPHVGYERASQLAKRAIATGAPVRTLILEEGLADEETLDRILDPCAMTGPEL